MSAPANKILHSSVVLGTHLSRYLRSLVLSRGDLQHATRVAQQFRDTPNVALIFKSVVEPGTTSHAYWANPLVQYGISDEFLEISRRFSVVDKLKPQFRTVPFSLAVSRQLSATAAAWVAEGAPIPATRFTLDSNLVLLPFKVGTLSAISIELAKSSH